MSIFLKFSAVALGTNCLLASRRDNRYLRAGVKRPGSVLSSHLPGQYSHQNECGVVTKLGLHALLAAIEHAHKWNNQSDIEITAYTFTCYLEMPFKGHKKIECLDRFHQDLW